MNLPSKHRHGFNTKANSNFHYTLQSAVSGGAFFLGSITCIGGIELSHSGGGYKSLAIKTLSRPRILEACQLGCSDAN